MQKWHEHKDEWLANRACELFRDRTGPELMLSRRLRKELPGVEIIEQRVLNGYIPDFLFPEYKLIVELDGSFHNREGGGEHDAKRDAQMFENGYRTIRFTNDAVLKSASMVVLRISREIGVRRIVNEVKSAELSKKKKVVTKRMLASAREHLNFRE